LLLMLLQAEQDDTVSAIFWSAGGSTANNLRRLLGTKWSRVLQCGWDSGMLVPSSNWTPQ